MIISRLSCELNVLRITNVVRIQPRNNIFVKDAGHGWFGKTEQIVHRKDGLNQIVFLDCEIIPPRMRFNAAINQLDAKPVQCRMQKRLSFWAFKGTS